MNLSNQIYVEKYEKMLAGKSAHTIRAYMKDIRKLCGYSNIDFSEMNVDFFMEFLNEVREHMSVNSFNSLVRNLSAFFSWMFDSGYIKENLFKKVRFGKSRFLRGKKEKKMTLTDTEVRDIIRAGANTQERFMLALMFFTAIRRGEVASIRMSDIKDCSILIHGKGNRERMIYLNSTLCTMLEVYMNERNTNSEYLFYGVRGDTSSDGKLSGEAINFRVKSAGKRAGISPERLEKLTAHRARATAITLIIETVGIHAAQKVAGHATLATTAIYDNSGEKEIKNALMGMKYGED